jgi:hypothetical protein
MSFEIVTEPIDRWPAPNTKQRENPRFKASYRDTLRSLSKELDHLDARGRVVIQVVTRNGATDLRRDGMLRAQAKIEHPGVRLSFESKHGPLTYATDQFEPLWANAMPGWQANLRAITLALEALRQVDRYGISKSGEQYRGWMAIEGSVGLAQDDAIAVLRKWGGRLADSLTVTDDRLGRLARIGAHPDRHGGDHGPSNEVLAAIAALGWDKR